MVELAYEHARGMYRSGDKELYRQLINLYVDKVVVYYDHVEFFLNTLPSDILRGELDRSLGIGEDETLVDYMQKCDPTIIEALKSIESNTKKGGTANGGTPDAYKEKKADKRAKNARLSTFIGGPSPAKNKFFISPSFSSSSLSNLSFISTLSSPE